MRELEDRDIRPLTRLGALGAQRVELENEIVKEIKKLRVDDVAWRWIGFALGVTTQAAWSRYGNPHSEKFVTLKDQGVLPIGDGSEALREAVLQHRPDHAEDQCTATGKDESKQESEDDEQGHVEGV